MRRNVHSGSSTRLVAVISYQVMTRREHTHSLCGCVQLSVAGGVPLLTFLRYGRMR